MSIPMLDFLNAVFVIQTAAKQAGCTVEIVISGDQLQDDGELSWQIGDQAHKNLPEWQDERNSRPFPY